MDEPDHSNDLNVETCIVGAGLGGLAIARELEDAGAEYVVLDKGRTPGGRAATRRFADSRFDHGLPWLTNAGPLTKALIDRGVTAGILGELADTWQGSPRWYSATGISSLGKFLAGDLNVRNRVRVTEILQAKDGLRLIADTNEGRSEVRVSRNLVLTAPLPQALELIEPLIGTSLRPESDPFDKCIVAMVRANPGLAADTGKADVVPEYLKFPDVLPGFSLRLSAKDSDALFDAGEDQIRSFVSEVLGFELPSDHVQLMKWRYANGSGVIKDPFFMADLGLAKVLVCGDAFFGGQASGTEAALRSAMAALEQLG